MFGVLFLDYAIHLDAAIGANGSTRGTADTTVGIGHHSKMVTSVIDILTSQSQHIGRTSHHTEVATLTPFGINNYSTYNFSHYSSIFSYLLIG